jgi:hypothetical protein
VLAVIPTFASIFSASFGGPGNGDGWALGRARPLWGQAEAAAMERTWRLYAQWQQVMRDFASVFSGDLDGSGDANGAGGDDASSQSAVYAGDDAALHFRVNSTTRAEVYDIVTEVLAEPSAMAAANCPGYKERWVELPNGLGLGTSWNLLWTWSKPHLDYGSLLIWQKVTISEGAANEILRLFLALLGSCLF